MSAEKTDAIVLRVIEFSESSCVVTLWTRDFGKMTALAKGARRPKSPFEAALDILAICRIVFLQKSSGAMDLLTEAKLQRRFRSAATNLDRLYAGFYVIELLNKLTEEKDPHPEIYDLALTTIEQIDGPAALLAPTDGNTNVAEPVSRSALDSCLMRFELGLLKELGLLPMLTQCVGCGRIRQTANRVHFGLNDGGVLCHNCRRGKANIVSVSPAAMETLLALTKFQDPEIGIEGAEVRKLLNRYMSHLLGFEPKMVAFLSSV